MENAKAARATAPAEAGRAPQWGPTDMTSSEVSLDELTQDWFYFLSTYRRQVRAMPVEVDWVRGRLEHLLTGMEAKSKQWPALRDRYSEVKHALVYFGDEILLNCQWGGEAAWARDLLEKRMFNTRHGGQDFFNRLDGCLTRSSPDVLAVYYRCLALGFQGKMLGQDLELAERRRNVYSRLGLGELKDHRIVPAAYEALDDREFEKLPGVGTARVLIATLALVVAMLVAAKLAVRRPWNAFAEAATNYVESNSTSPREAKD